MKLKEGFMLSRVAGIDVVVPVQEQTFQFGGMVRLNKTGAILWTGLEQQKGEEELVQMLTEAYPITAAEAREDVKAFLKQLAQIGCLDE